MSSGESWYPEVVLVICLLSLVSAHPNHREHKVHNIVLYPDKHSWCSATAIKQVVGQPGCEPVEVENWVCVGGCFSYTIPRTEPRAPGEVAPYCDSCQPKATTWKHVSLKCTSGEYQGETLRKRVEIINGCQCWECGGGGGGGAGRGGSSDPPPGGEPPPQLLDLVDLAAHAHAAPNASASNPAPGGPAHHPTFDSETNHRLSVLLKRLTEEEDKGTLDKDSLDDILWSITGDHQDSAQDSADPAATPTATHHHNRLDLADNQQEEEAEDSSPVSVDIVKLRHVLARDGHHRHHHSTKENKPTLDVASHHFKPAVAGSEISYHGTRETLQSEETSESQP